MKKLFTSLPILLIYAFSLFGCGTSGEKVPDVLCQKGADSLRRVFAQSQQPAGQGIDPGTGGGLQLW